MTETITILAAMFFPLLGCILTFLWINTSAFIEYAKLLRIGKLFGIERYEAQKVKFESLSYPDYLVMQKNNFLTRLLSCPVCLGCFLQALFFVWHLNAIVLVWGVYVGWVAYFALNKITQ